MNLKLKMTMRQFALSVVALLVIAYIILQFVLSVGDIVTTQVAEYVEASELVALEAAIFRDETVVYNNTNGTVCYLVDDGEKIGASQAVLDIYDVADDAGIQSQIKALRDKIEILTKSSAAASTSDLKYLDSGISALIMETARNTQDGVISSTVRKRNEILIYMNRRMAVLKLVESFDKQIAALNNEIARLESGIKGTKHTVYSKNACNFVYSVDGYENIFSFDKLESLTLKSYDQLLNTEYDEDILNRGVGKFYNNSTWYATVKVTKRMANDFVIGQEYDMVFPYSLDVELSMKLEKKITQTDSDDALLVFSSRTNYPDFSFLRYQPVELKHKTYKGLSVPKSAIRVKDGQEGVYALDGNVVKFKSVDILFEQAGNYICALPDDYNIATIDENKLSLYDIIIIEGNQIYEGRVLS